MDIIKRLQEDSDLAEILCDICDVNILPEFISPQDEDKHLTYNIHEKHLPRKEAEASTFCLEMARLAFGEVKEKGAELQTPFMTFLY